MGRLRAQQRAGDPDARGPRPVRDGEAAWGGGRAFQRGAARQRRLSVRSRAQVRHRGRSRAGRLGAAGAFAGALQARREAREGMVGDRRTGRVARPRGGFGDDRLGGVVRRLLEPDRRPHQSARAHPRSCRCRVAARRGDLRALARDLVQSRQRALDGEDRERFGDGACLRACDQCLHRRVRAAARAGDRTRSHPGAVLADGDQADQQQRRARPSSRTGRRCRIPTASSISRAGTRATGW